VFFLFLTPVKMVLGVPPTGIVKEIPTGSPRSALYVDHLFRMSVYKWGRENVTQL
jgi:hypothetical protein